MVSYNPTTRSLAWKIIDGDNSLQQRSFGKNNDTAISGGDFDGDGIADAVVARQSHGQVVWNIRYNIFNVADGSATNRRGLFGSDVTKAFYAAITGERDWLGSIRKSTSGKPIVRFKEIVTGKVPVSYRFPAFIADLRPFPVRMANGTAILGFSRVIDGKTRLNFLRADGRTFSRVTLSALGDVVVGDFGADAGEEVAVKDPAATDFKVYNPFTRKTTTVAAATGIAVDSINLNTVSSNSSTPTPTPTASYTPTPTSSGGTPTFPKYGTTISCTSVVDISTLPNLLYQNENIHGSRGRTWLDQGHRQGGTRRVYIATGSM